VEITSHTSRFSRPVFSSNPRHKRFFTPVDGVMAYSLSKRALLTFIYGLNKRLMGTGVSINAVTPGWTRTGMANNNGPFWHAVMDFLRLFMQPVEAGIRPIVHLATAPEMRGISGCYYRRYELMPPNHTWASDVLADQLWEMSELMVGEICRFQ
jgi:NAD(P)-dependent dehydrogenase (short-subunit alcohol dehydrogenase family)